MSGTGVRCLARVCDVWHGHAMGGMAMLPDRPCPMFQSGLLPEFREQAGLKYPTAEPSRTRMRQRFQPLTYTLRLHYLGSSSLPALLIMFQFFYRVFSTPGATENPPDAVGRPPRQQLCCASIGPLGI